MKMTLSKANKELKKLSLKKYDVKRRIADNSTFVSSIQEDTESNRPAFDLNAEIDNFNSTFKEIVELKHKISKYNLTTKLVGLDEELTIDEALVILPLLNEEMATLSGLMNTKDKTRVPNQVTIDYRYINFNQNELKGRYQAVVDRIDAIQLALDKTNNTVMLEF